MRHKVPVDDVKEVFDDGNLLEHKLHFPIHVLLKQMDISRIQQFKITQLSYTGDSGKSGDSGDSALNRQKQD